MRDREQLISKVVELIPFEGVSDETLLKACRELDYEFCKFPSGIVEILKELESSFDASLCDHMVVEVESLLRVRDRVATAVKFRIMKYLCLPNHREFLRKEVEFFLCPSNSLILLEVVGKTVSNIWYCIGDRSIGFDYYTKRLSLSAVYISTVLYFIDDFSEDFADTFAFLDRRIENVLQFHKLKMPGVLLQNFLR